MFRNFASEIIAENLKESLHRLMGFGTLTFCACRRRRKTNRLADSRALGLRRLSEADHVTLVSNTGSKLVVSIM